MVAVDFGSVATEDVARPGRLTGITASQSVPPAKRLEPFKERLREVAQGITHRTPWLDNRQLMPQPLALGGRLRQDNTSNGPLEID